MQFRRGDGWQWLCRRAYGGPGGENQAVEEAEERAKEKPASKLPLPNDQLKVPVEELRQLQERDEILRAMTEGGAFFKGDGTLYRRLIFSQGDVMEVGLRGREGLR